MNIDEAKTLAGVDPKLVTLRQYALTASIKLHTGQQEERPSELVQGSVVLKDADSFMVFMLEGKVT